MKAQVRGRALSLEAGEWAKGAGTDGTWVPGELAQPGEQEVSEQMASPGLFRWKDQEKEQGTVPELWAKRRGERSCWLSALQTHNLHVSVASHGKLGQVLLATASRVRYLHPRGSVGWGCGRQLPTLHRLEAAFCETWVAALLSAARDKH